MVRIAAPVIAVSLLLVWLSRPLTPEALSVPVLRVIAIGCRDQNPRRTRLHGAMRAGISCLTSMG